MPINPHPIVLNATADQRRAELLALADRERQRRLAQGAAGRRRLWPDRSAFPAVAGLLSLLLAAARQG